VNEKLENIGFYTLSDERAANVSDVSQMKRCEMIKAKKEYKSKKN
jgi:hypothetical protein